MEVPQITEPRREKREKNRERKGEAGRGGAGKTGGLPPPSSSSSYLLFLPFSLSPKRDLSLSSPGAKEEESQWLSLFPSSRKAPSSSLSDPAMEEGGGAAFSSGAPSISAKRKKKKSYRERRRGRGGGRRLRVALPLSLFGGLERTEAAERGVGSIAGEGGRKEEEEGRRLRWIMNQGQKLTSSTADEDGDGWTERGTGDGGMKRGEEENCVWGFRRR